MSIYKKVYPKFDGDVLYKPHKYLGYLLSPNVKSFYFRKYSKEHYYTNNFGWRVESANVKTSYTDFFIIGASFVMGIGVEFKDTIGNLLSKRINKKISNIGVGGYNDIQILRKIDLDSSKIKPKLVILIYEDLIGRSFRPSALQDIVHSPFFRINIKTNKFKLIEANELPYFFFKRFVNLEKKGRLKKLNFINNLEKKTLWLFFQFYNQKVKNFFLRIFGLSKYKYVSTNDKKGRIFILKFLIKEIGKLVDKYNFKVLIWPLYPYYKVNISPIKQSTNIKRFYNEVNLLSKLIKKQKKIKNIFIENSKVFENAHNLFFKKKNIKDKNFFKELQWKDNNHPTPKGTKIIADCIYKSMLKFNLNKL